MSAVEIEQDIYFIDTNIWLYAFIEGSDHQKMLRARETIKTSRTIVVSIQVINEACINLIKKAQFSESQIQQLIRSFYNKYLVVNSSKELLLKASTLRDKYTLSFWDSLIVASSLVAGASVLYSEDMHDGLVVETKLRIVNPFLIQKQTGA